MAFTLPNFNLTCNIWRGPPADFRVGPPDVVSPCNLAYGRRVNPGSFGFATNSEDGPVFLLLPALTDIRGSQAAVGPDNVECPAFSSRFYTVLFVEDAGKGFANEHRVALLTQNQNLGWPYPTP